jgi:hypothetical protein
VRRVGLVIIAIGWVGVVGCSVFTSLDDLQHATSDAQANDGAPSDVAQQNDVVQTNDAGDAGGNLVNNGGFENGQGGCGTNWGNGYSDTFSRVSPGHTGSSACLVCTNNANNQSYQIDAIANIPITAGNYYAEAWIVTPWDGGAATQSVGIQVRFVGDAGGISSCTGDGTSYCQGSFVSPGTGWTSSSTTFVASGPGALQIAIHSYDGTPSSCFAMDDVAVYQQ